MPLITVDQQRLGSTSHPYKCEPGGLSVENQHALALQGMDQISWDLLGLSDIVTLADSRETTSWNAPPAREP